MLSGLSSSLSTAMRTAGTARATMDTMTRQIATGKKVASVKEDGAAWTRAAGLRTAKVDHEGRLFALDRVDAGLRSMQAVTAMRREALENFKALILSARQHAAGSDARGALAAEWSAMVASAKAYQPNDSTFTNTDGYGNDASGIGVRMVGSGDPLLEGERWAIEPITGVWFTTMGVGRPVALTAVNLATASSAQLDDAWTSVTTMLGHDAVGWAGAWDSQTGADMRTSERMRDYSVDNLDRLDTAIGSLTDADLGKASKARAQAEIRQQLALDTVRTAISAYGNFASGLLGNLQRTQRGIIA